VVEDKDEQAIDDKWSAVFSKPKAKRKAAAPSEAGPRNGDDDDEEVVMEKRDAAPQPETEESPKPPVVPAFARELALQDEGDDVVGDWELLADAAQEPGGPLVDTAASTLSSEDQLNMPLTPEVCPEAREGV